MRVVYTPRQPDWDEFWRALGALGELSTKEAGLIGDAARRGLALNWEREASPGGQPWRPLRPLTQKLRAARGFAPRHPILVQTKDLKSSFTERSHPRNIQQIGYVPGGTVIVIGARENPETPGRMRLLHFGGWNKWGRFIPPRPYLGLSDRALRWVDGQATAVILQRVERLKNGG